MPKEDEHAASLKVINIESNNSCSVLYFNTFLLYDTNKWIIGNIFMGSHMPGVAA